MGTGESLSPLFSVVYRNEEITDRCGNKTAYEYDENGRTTRVTSKNSYGTPLASVNYSYNSFDNLTEIARGDGMKYALTYNEFHNLESIKVDGEITPLVTNTYKNGNGRLKAVTYANGHNMKITYNAAGQITDEKWYDSDGMLTNQYKYVYDGEGNIVRSIDIKAQKEYNYYYDGGVLKRAVESSITLDSNQIVTSKAVVNTIVYSYNNNGELTKKKLIPTSGDAQEFYYSTVGGKTVTGFYENGHMVTSRSKNDDFGRKEFEELQLGPKTLYRKFEYHKGVVSTEHIENSKVKSDPTTQLVSKITYSDGRTIEYEYDAEERITKVIDSVDGTTEYTYDALGQLVTEKRNGSYVNSMSYDSYGNILYKNGASYEYCSQSWKDLLTSYDGCNISYDPQGNPISYLGHVLAWEKGRQLKSFDSNTYTYNANGIRTSKRVNGVTHTYTLEGTKIIRETWSNKAITPLYDNEDSVCGIIYKNGTSTDTFYFIKNLQGDVIAITDSAGTVVAKYRYDAWGKCTTVSDSSGRSIAYYNPFHYRGYYYDTETSLYYLQSRYYDPEVGRFINADKSLGADNDLSTYALYSYCGNSPIDRYDLCGNSWSKIWSGFKKLVRKTLNKTNKIMVSLGIDTAAFGAYLLNMSNENGIYHANFNCWQQYFGYNDFYDFMFDIGTSMKNVKFSFVSGKKSYILWAWKGNYINLGAGAELGIYYGGEPHWFVDKNLAMNMSMIVKHKGVKIFSYSKNTWWITGFDPRYLDAKASDLKVSFTVKFNKSTLYRDFSNKWRRIWACNDGNKTASYTF